MKVFLYCVDLLTEIFPDSSFEKAFFLLKDGLRNPRCKLKELSLENIEEESLVIFVTAEQTKLFRLQDFQDHQYCLHLQLRAI